MMTTIRMGHGACLMAATLFTLSTSSLQAAGSAPQPTICTRACWGAQAVSAPSQMGSLTRAIVHHTAGNEFGTTGLEASKANVRGIQSLHISKGYGDIGYHFLVDKFGNTFEGRVGSMSSLPRGAHDATNSNSFGFNAMGFFHTPNNNVPTNAMMNALYAVIAWRMPAAWRPYGSPGLYGELGRNVGYVDSHRNVKSTACPGDLLHNPYIGNDTNAGVIRNEINARINGVDANPPHWFSSGTEGWRAGNGMGTVNWTNQPGWTTGIIWSDQVGSDGFLMGPPCNFAGDSAFNSAVNVKVYVGGGSSASHDMKLYWTNHADSTWSESKASPTVPYTIQNGWRIVNLNVNSLQWGAMWIKQLRLDLDGNNVGGRFHIDRINVVKTPRSYFDSSGQGWGANGMGPITWTNQYGWPGVIFADQTANDGMFISPAISNFLGAANDKVRVRLYPGGGNSASHDIQLFWTTSGENFYSAEKSTPVTNYTAQNAWVDLMIPVGPWKWEDNWITGLRVDVDGISKGTRWHIDMINVEH